jgi:hypothetical protein
MDAENVQIHFPDDYGAVFLGEDLKSAHKNVIMPVRVG